MNHPLHILYVEDREEHILQARIMLHRLKIPIELHIARSIVLGERIARSLLNPNNDFTSIIISDIHLPFSTFDTGVDGTFLLNLLASEIRDGKLKQAILVGISSEMTTNRALFGSYATKDLWDKPLKIQHIERLQELITQGPPWVLPIPEEHIEQASVHQTIVQQVMGLANRLWLKVRPDDAKRQGKAILGILTRAIVLTAEEYTEGLQLTQQYGGTHELRVYLTAVLRKAEKIEINLKDRQVLLDLLEGLPQARAMERANLSRRKGLEALERIYDFISTSVLSKP